MAEPAKELRISWSGANMLISLPERPIDPDATVVTVDLEGPPEVEPFSIGPGRDGRIELPVTLADIQSEMGQRVYLDHFYRTTMLANWQNVNDYPVWEFATDKAGTYELQISYASMWGGQASYEVDGWDGWLRPKARRASISRKRSPWARSLSSRGSIRSRSGSPASSTTTPSIWRNSFSSRRDASFIHSPRSSIRLPRHDGQNPRVRQDV
jgi:hypothetical protein